MGRVWFIVTLNTIAIIFLSITNIANSYKLKRIEKDMVEIIKDMSQNRYKNENQLLMKVKELEYTINCVSSEVDSIKIEKRR